MDATLHNPQSELKSLRQERRPAAFIDRDGVINVDHGYVHKAEDFELLPGVINALQRLAACGYALVVITNQSGIARGLYTEADLALVTAHMSNLLMQKGVRIDGIYHCPHHPQGNVARYRIECACRKPEPGLIFQAAKELGLDLSHSVLVGDKGTDAQAGRAAGLEATVLVESGHPLGDDAQDHADHRCADLSAAADWLCKRNASIYECVGGAQ